MATFTFWIIICLNLVFPVPMLSSKPEYVPIAVTKLPNELLWRISDFLDAESVCRFRGTCRKAYGSLNYDELRHVPHIIDRDGVDCLKSVYVKNIKDPRQRLRMLMKFFEWIDRKPYLEKSIRDSLSSLDIFNLSRDDAAFRQLLEDILVGLRRKSFVGKSLFLESIISPFLESTRNELVWMNLAETAVAQDLPEMLQYLLYQPNLKKLFEKKIPYLQLLEKWCINSVIRNHFKVLTWILSYHSYYSIDDSLTNFYGSTIAEEEGQEELIKVNYSVERFHRLSLSSFASDESTCFPSPALSDVAVTGANFEIPDHLDPAFENNKLLEFAVNFEHVDIINLLLSFPSVSMHPTVLEIFTDLIMANDLEIAELFVPHVDINDEEWVWALLSVAGDKKKSLEFIFRQENFKALPKSICNLILDGPEKETFSQIRNRIRNSKIDA